MTYYVLFQGVPLVQQGIGTCFFHLELASSGTGCDIVLDIIPHSNFEYLQTDG
jgi:hypothetical protein